MLISLSWLLRLLPTPSPDPQSVVEALIHAGFPVESREPLGGGDERLDVEITSNRGDCLSHVGLAREVGAKLGLELRHPAARELPPPGPPVGQVLALENRVPEVCPRFTARVIRGVRVGPSPAWLAGALAAIGQRPINNVVDVTNYIAAHHGNPCHVFDLSRLAGGGWW
jgi:phenylalanyl-tRNA synthetase beta chain